ncbi:MAG: hypothetical protein JWL73_3692 [Actinomycetia bacterium]|nr:hypothetical protein [Actinomycetes bacterium]
MTAPEAGPDKPESAIEEIQQGIEHAVENTAERAPEDEAGPVDDKSAPAT